MKLWFVIRHYGVEGLQYHLRRHVELTQQFVKWVDASPVFERFAPAPLTTVCFRAHPPGLDNESELNRFNEDLLKAINASGEIYLTHTKLNGKYTLRLAVGNIRTEEKHVQWAWQLLQAGVAKMVGDDS